MSRHRAVRNLDYDDVLDEASAEGQMTPQQADSLDRAVDLITQRLGEGFNLKEVRETAWHYYFDVDKSTDYLLGSVLSVPY